MCRLSKSITAASAAAKSWDAWGFLTFDTKQKTQPPFHFLSSHFLFSPMMHCTFLTWFGNLLNSVMNLSDPGILVVRNLLYSYRKSLRLHPLAPRTHPSPSAQVTVGGRNAWMDGPPCTHTHRSCSFTNIWQSLSPDLVQTEETQKDKSVDLLQKHCCCSADPRSLWNLG